MGSGLTIMQRMIRLLCAFAVLLACSLAGAQQSQPQASPRSKFFSPLQWETERAFEVRLNAMPDPKKLRAWHDMLASEPHIAGTEGDQRVIESIAKAFGDMGLAVQVHEFWALLSEPVDAKLEIVGEKNSQAAGAMGDIAAHAGESAPPARHGVTALPITEDNLLNDPYVTHPGLTFGWNAYSGSGDVSAGVVYANFGTKEDFETLKARGVDCTGKIVLARYGGNFRGYKAKYAEAAGAVGLIIFTDPDDSGYRKGVTYPEGGWANDTCIQRGSIITSDQPGDPLTPGIPATKDARRLDVDSVGLPRIPVQPIGYRAAAAIMTKMTGTPLPEDLIKDWQGGLPCAYRLNGGDELKLRLMVKQNRMIKKTANIIATLRGESEPDQCVYLGSHHDAWGFGAGDPTSGTILVMETARSFAQLAQAGLRPRRSIAFCCWGAEEFGVIGSTEYCEQFGDELRQRAVAYINLDGATMGVNFGASSDPLLKTVIEESTREVPQARSKEGKSVFEAWKAEKAAPVIGNLGGGSDHVGFYCHLGIPSCFISSGGAPGTAYHSNYDNLAWYRRTVGDDYEPALMLTRVVNVLAARLANAEIPPFDPSRYGDDVREHVKALKARAEKRQLTLDFASLDAAIEAADKSVKDCDAALTAMLENDGPAERAARMNVAATLHLEGWASIWQPSWPDGLAGREWFRNIYASSDPQSGYASWMLPALRGPIENADPIAAKEAMTEYVGVLERLGVIAESVGAAANLGNGSPAIPATSPN